MGVQDQGLAFLRLRHLHAGHVECIRVVDGCRGIGRMFVDRLRVDAEAFDIIAPVNQGSGDHRLDFGFFTPERRGAHEILEEGNLRFEIGLDGLFDAVDFGRGKRFGHGRSRADRGGRCPGPYQLKPAAESPASFWPQG